MFSDPSQDSFVDRATLFLLHLGVFLAPFRVFRPTELAVTFSDLVFLLLCVVMIARRQLLTSPFRDVTILWFTANLLFIGGFFASSIINGSPTAALVICTQYFFAYVFLPFVIFSNNENVSINIVKTFVFSSLVIVLCGFVFAWTGYEGSQKYVTGSGRLASFAGNPNGLASQIALTVPLLLYLLVSKNMNYVLCSIIFIVLGIGLIMTSSNGGLACATLGVATFFVCTGKLRWIVGGSLAAAIAALTVATVGYDYLPEIFRKRVLQGLETGDLDQAGTYEDRMALIVEASEWLDGSLLLGIGADQYRELSYWGAPVHNQYLLVWVEGGTIALFGWLLILCTCIFIGVRSYRLPGAVPAAAALLAVTTVLSLVATTTTHLYARFWILPVFCMIGVIMAKHETWQRATIATDGWRK